MKSTIDPEPINDDISLRNLQAYIWRANIDRGFDETLASALKLV